MNQLSCEHAKRIDMVDYLHSLNHQPQRIHNQDYWYLSPLRQEKTASFKVNRTLNVWFDFAMGKGGDIIDFGTLYHNCSISDLLKTLSGFSNKPTLSFHPPHVLGSATATHPGFAGEKKESADSKIVLLDSRPLQSEGLLNYLTKRCISPEIASVYCREVDFSLYGKQHTVIGFPNNAGGYELRNEHFKGSSSPKHTTYINNEMPRLVVFEGFFSFLSFCTINKNDATPLSNALILNSLSFFDKSCDLMEQHLRVHLLLDADTAGKKNTQKALDWNREKYVDRSEFYGGHKDLNDWLINHCKSLKPVQRTGKRL